MVNKKIDEKHHIEVTNIVSDEPVKIQIIKTTNGQPIPDDEPLILFRGRDRLAVPMLEYYRILSIKDNATQYQIDTMNTIITKFMDYTITHSINMKQPGITKGL